MASWGSYVFELCRINANQGLTAEIDWNYTSWSRRCRKILIGLVVRGAKTVVVRGKNRILTRNRKKPEMTVPISFISCFIVPMFPVFTAGTSGADDSIGVLLLEIWCAYFIPVCVLGYKYFTGMERKYI
jgi:hypothetical protein